MKLSHIFSGIDFKIEGRDVGIERLVVNSSKVTKGDLFFAVVGVSSDGAQLYR